MRGFLELVPQAFGNVSLKSLVTKKTHQQPKPIRTAVFADNGGFNSDGLSVDLNKKCLPITLLSHPLSGETCNQLANYQFRLARRQLATTPNKII